MRLQVAGARSRRGRYRARSPAALGLSLATFATLGAPTGIEGSRDTASKSHTFFHTTHPLQIWRLQRLGPHIVSAPTT